jgi:hypothetical protein
MRPETPRGLKFLKENFKLLADETLEWRCKD